MKKKSLALGALLGTLAVSVLGPGQSTVVFAADGEEIGAFGHYPETIEVSVSNPVDSTKGYINGDTPEDNPITRYFYEKTNIKMKYAWEVPSSEYDKKVSLTIASGDLPDIMLVRDKIQLQELVENDLVEDLTGTFELKAADYVKDIYNSWGDDAFSTAMYDGKLMAVPDLCYGYQFSMAWIRQDWLDKLGLEMPQTREELETVAKAFIDNDMSGKGNTVGITCSSDVAGFYNRAQTLDPILNTFDAYPRSWVVNEDGTVEYGTVQSQMKDALTYLRHLYEEGILDKEFAVRTGDDLNEIVLSGRCGITFGPWWIPDGEMGNAVVNDPECNWVPCMIPLSDDGKFHPMQQNYHENWIVVRKGYEHPEIVWEFLNFSWLRGADKDLVAVRDQYWEDGGEIWYGVGPGGYCMVQYNDAVPKDAENLEKALETGDTSELNGDGQAYYPACKRWVDDKDPEAWGDYAARVAGSLAISDDSKIDIKKMYYPSTTQTMSMNWSSLEDLENQMILKVIMGEEDIDYFDEFVKDWNAMGGEQITKEVNEEYQKELAEN